MIGLRGCISFMSKNEEKIKSCCEDCIFDCSYYEMQEWNECFFCFEKDLEDFWFIFIDEIKNMK